MAKEFVLISINTNIETSNADFGLKFLNLLSDFDEKLCPEVYSCIPDKITKPYNSAEDAMSKWLATKTVGFQNSSVTSPTNFYWKRKRAVKYSGTIVHSGHIGENRTRRWGKINIEFAVNKKIDWFSLFKELCVLSEAEYGMLHLFTSHELKPVPFKSPEMSFQLGPSSAVIQRGEIPELAWANFFSKELVQGADIAGLKADGFQVDEQSNNSVLLSLSDSIFDVKDDFLLFAEKRALAKRRFTTGFFGVDASSN